MAMGESGAQKPGRDDGGDLLESLRKWLHDEGYPLEFAAAEAFRKAGFSVRQGDYTEPTATDPPREIDVTAEMAVEGKVLLRVEHVIECKWSGKNPWVLFCGGRGMSTAACVTQSIASSFAGILLWKEAGDLRLEDLGVFATPRRPAFGGREAFTKSRDLMFDAVRSVTGKCHLLADQYEPDGVYGRHSDLLPRAAVVNFPVIVVDGRLFEAKQGDQSLDLREVEASRIHWRGAERHRHAFATIDVVRADHLEKFAAQRAKDCEVLLQVMARARDEVLERIADRTIDQLSVTQGARGVRGAPPLLRRFIEAAKASTGTTGATLDISAGKTTDVGKA